MSNPVGSDPGRWSQLNVRMPREDYDELAKAAHDEDLSMSQLVRRLLREYLRDHHQMEPPS